MIFVFFCFFKKKGIKKEKKPVLEAFTDESSIVIRHERTEHILKKIKEKKKIKKSCAVDGRLYYTGRSRGGTEEEVPYGTPLLAREVCTLQNYPGTRMGAGKASFLHMTGPLDVSERSQMACVNWRCFFWRWMGKGNIL